jgi:arginyl-tRNA synthetase
MNIGRGRKVVVEHTSVNPQKALHIGHLRNLALGDTIARLLRFTGHAVQVLNYIDDSGLQVADVVVGFRFAQFPVEAPPGEKFDHYSGDHVYVKVNQLYEAHPELLERRKEVLRALEDPNSEMGQFARQITRLILRAQLETCWRVGARYDLLNFESHILEMHLWDRVFGTLKKQGLVSRPETGQFAGCWIVRVPGEAEGEEKVLLRSDGTATYVAKDIPYAAWKLGLAPDRFRYERFVNQPDGTPLWATGTAAARAKHPAFGHAEVAITVIDVRQARLQRIIAYILSRLAGSRARRRYLHLGYEVVALSGDTVRAMGFDVGDRHTVHMSGRTGIYINVDDVLDTLHRRAYEESQKRNPAASVQWLHDVAEQVAVGALRLSLVKADLDKQVVFDLKEALRLEGETGPYLQYSLARAARILEKAGAAPHISRAACESLSDPHEWALGKSLARLDLMVEETARSLAPKALARYLFDVATAFNLFYEKLPVLQEVDVKRQEGRLALVGGFRNVGRQAMQLLGVPVLDRL